MKREQKDYIGRRFEVEPTKLTKLVQVMHEKLAGPGDQSDSYFVYMVGDHRAELQTLDDVLALDNSAKHRIVRLRIHSECRAPNGTSPQSEIDVDFGATFKTGSDSAQTGVSTGVSVEVAGESRAWVADTLSEIEQQVERSWVQHGLPIVSIGLIILAWLFTILLAILGPRSETGQIARELSTTMWLTGDDLSPYAEKLSRAETLSEDEQRQIFSKQMANVNALFKHYDHIERESLSSVGKSLLAVAAIAAVGMVLLVRGYPAAVFLWGDEKSRQETRERIKRVLWPLLLAISFIPVVVQLFLSSLLSGFR
jgi:hypothetical protein